MWFGPKRGHSSFYIPNTNHQILYSYLNSLIKTFLSIVKFCQVTSQNYPGSVSRAPLPLFICIYCYHLTKYRKAHTIFWQTYIYHWWDDTYTTMIYLETIRPRTKVCTNIHITKNTVYNTKCGQHHYWR